MWCGLFLVLMYVGMGQFYSGTNPHRRKAKRLPKYVAVNFPFTRYNRNKGTSRPGR